MSTSALTAQERAPALTPTAPNVTTWADLADGDTEQLDVVGRLHHEASLGHAHSGALRRGIHDLAIRLIDARLGERRRVARPEVLAEKRESFGEGHHLRLVRSQRHPQLLHCRTCTSCGLPRLVAS